LWRGIEVGKVAYNPPPATTLKRKPRERDTEGKGVRHTGCCEIMVAVRVPGCGVASMGACFGGASIAEGGVGRVEVVVMVFSFFFFSLGD